MSWAARLAALALVLVAWAVLTTVALAVAARAAG